MKKWPLLTLTLITVFLLAGPVSARQGDTSGAEVLAELDFLVGTWDVSGTVRADASADLWSDFVGLATVDWDLDGHLLRQELTGTADGTVLQALGVWQYDRFQQGVALLWTSVGVIDGLFRLYGEYTARQYLAYSRDVGAALRVSVAPRDDGTLVVTIGTAHSITSADYADLWRLTYTRRTEPVPADWLPAAERIPPPPETAQLAFWIGDWEIASRNLIDEEWVEMPAGQQVFWSLDGHALEDYWTGNLFGEDRLRWGIARYNASLDSWERANADTSDSGFGMDWGGQCTAPDNCFIGGDHYQPGDDGHLSWYHIHGDAGRIWEQEYTLRDGG